MKRSVELVDLTGEENRVGFSEKEARVDVDPLSRSSRAPFLSDIQQNPYLASLFDQRVTNGGAGPFKESHVQHAQSTMSAHTRVFGEARSPFHEASRSTFPDPRREPARETPDLGRINTHDLPGDLSDDEESPIVPEDDPDRLDEEFPFLGINNQPPWEAPLNTTHNRYGQPHIKLVNYKDNLDCLIEKFRRDRSLNVIKNSTRDYSGPGWVRLSSYAERGIEIRTDSFTHLELRDGTFIRVGEIGGNTETGEVVVVGWKLHPTGDLNPALPAAENEVCLVLEVEEKSNNLVLHGKVIVPVSEAVRNREIRFTNSFDPTVRHEAHSISDGPLSCRWKLIIWYRDDFKAGKRIAAEFSIETLTEREADPECAVADDNLRWQWRGSPSSETGHLYTFSDGFCGAGGTSAGAQQAGLRISRAFDLDFKACKSYEANFEEAQLFNVSVEDYCRMRNLEPVTISHYSIVCKTYSPAHTTVGKDDEANEATSYSVESLLDTDKPRLTTFENTSGLWTHHADLMYPIIGQYTSKGFSIRFRLLNLADWGLPQSRKRLVLIGACPGESLPRFPTPTHTSNPSNNPDLQRYVGLGEAIMPLENAELAGFEVPNHDPGNQHIAQRSSFGNEKLAKCVTCKGGGNYHPSGERKLTVRELAVAQGFHLFHQFWSDGGRKGGRTAQKEQIGNAFPSLFTMHLYRMLQMHLQARDGYMPSNPPVQGRPYVDQNGRTIWVEPTVPMAIWPLDNIN